MAYCMERFSGAYRVRRLKKWSVRCCALIGGCAAVCGAALFSGRIGWLGCTVLTVVAGGLLFWKLGLIGLFDSDWDGEVIGKEKFYTHVKGRILDRSGDVPRDKEGHAQPYVGSILKVKRLSDGRVFRYSRVDHDEAPEVCYYRVGDRVRHYARLPLYEKEDKSQDRWTLCLGCLTLSRRDETRCKKCGLPLLTD